MQNSTYSYQYDANGNMTQVTGPLGNVTNQTYDALNRVTQQLQPMPVAGAARPAISYTYDGQDQVTAVTDPRSLVTRYTTDGLGNQTALASPDSGSSSATYDAAGNVATSTDARGNKKTYSYDVLNRLTKIATTSGLPTTFEYDGGSNPTPAAIGHLTKMTDSSGNTTYSYDGFGRLLTLMLEHGADIRFIQAMLGHADLSATQIYAQVSIRMLSDIDTATHPGSAIATGQARHGDADDYIERDSLLAMAPGATNTLAVKTRLVINAFDK